MPPKFNFHPILDFLDILAQNNYKGWFDSNRAEYESAREIFNQFVDYLIDELRVFDNLQGLTAKECVTRIYRDIRFTRDKSPYHTNFSAIIAPGGKKSPEQGYYVSIQPHDQTLVAGGLYMPSPEQLERFRQAIDQHAATFKRITANKLAKPSKFLSPPQADGVLRNFAPSGTGFAKAWNPRSKLRSIL
jgi:uncharacterized protein (TIGR02453 family)